MLFRDIKSEQILLSGFSAKLAGFGFSSDLDSGRRNSLVSHRCLGNQNPILYNVCIFWIFTNILLLSKTYRRPVGDRNAWSEIYRRPTFLIGDIDMLHRKPTCLIGDPLEADFPAESNRNSKTNIKIYIFLYFLIIYIGIL